MNCVLLNKKGENVGNFDLPTIFDSTVNQELLNLAVKIFLGNQRQTNASTKDRGDVAGSGKKLYKQKGTGNARRGSIRSPLMRKGGIVFGPSNAVNYKRSLNKAQRGIAISSAFAKLALDKKVFVLEDMQFELSTSEVDKFLKVSNISKVRFVSDTINSNLLKATAAIPNANVDFIDNLNVYNILNSGNIVLSKESVLKIQQMWGK